MIEIELHRRQKKGGDANGKMAAGKDLLTTWKDRRRWERP